MKTLHRFLSTLGLVSVLLAACVPVTESAPTLAPTEPAPIYADPAQPVEARVADLLARMTLEEKIGQMAVVENYSITPADAAASHVGAIMSGSTLSENTSLTMMRSLASGYQEQAVKTRLGIPILFAINSIHGFAMVNGATVFPHNIGLGASRDPELVREVGRITATEMRAAGIPWNFAPVVAVPQDIRWGRTYEGFGEDTGLVSELSAAYVRGFQIIPAGSVATPGQSLYALATPKHFIGEGATVWGSSTQSMNDVAFMLDQGNAQIPEADLRAYHLPPYQAVVDSGAMSIMAAFNSWQGTKMHAQRRLLNDVLKDEIGFPGILVSEWGGIDQVNSNYYDAVVTSVNAGIDMAIVPYDYASFLGVMQRAVENNDISEARVDDAVGRILRVKFMLGLFENPYGDPALADTVGSPEHRAVARRAVRESLVLLKNENEALPIDKGVSTILVAGPNSTGMLAGGWTLVGWQGVEGNVLQGTTILNGIKQLAGSDTEVLYSYLGEFPGIQGKAPVGVAVVGEMPYGEGVGDSADLSLSETDILTMNNLRVKVEKLVVIIVSGRPLVITDQFQIADAWVAAWLPGSEGVGVADVLFGDYPFTGKLPYTWPRSNEQLPITVRSAAGLTGCAAPLFPFGYGLGLAGSQPIEWIDCP
jgi:beta-glucosidase